MLVAVSAGVPVGDAVGVIVGVDVRVLVGEGVGVAVAGWQESKYVTPNSCAV